MPPQGGSSSDPREKAVVSAAFLILCVISLESSRMMGRPACTDMRIFDGQGQRAAFMPWAVRIARSDKESIFPYPIAISPAGAVFGFPDRGECMERRRGGADTREWRRREAYRRIYGRRGRRRRNTGGAGRERKLLLILAAAALLLFLLFLKTNPFALLLILPLIHLHPLLLLFLLLLFLLLLLLLLLPLILLPWLILPASKITISLSQTWTRPEWKKRR